jgi:hypothetical protein
MIQRSVYRFADEVMRQILTPGQLHWPDETDECVALSMCGSSIVEQGQDTDIGAKAGLAN